MIMDVERIENEIRQLEQAETNWANIERLSLLYNVYDHINGDVIPIFSRTVEKVMPQTGEGEFCETCNGVKIEPFMKIMSEHMAVIKTLHPKEYEAVLEQIRGIS